MLKNWGEIEFVLDISLLCLLAIQVKIRQTICYKSLEFRGNSWAKDVNLMAIDVFINVFKIMGLNGFI